MVGLVLICVHSRGCIAPHPHLEVNTGVPMAKVSAAEVKFSISEGGRREREQVNTSNMGDEGEDKHTMGSQWS